MEHGDMVGDWRLLLIRHARSSGQVVGAKSPLAADRRSKLSSAVGQALAAAITLFISFSNASVSVEEHI